MKWIEKAGLVVFLPTGTLWDLAKNDELGTELNENHKEPWLFLTSQRFS